MLQEECINVKFGEVPGIFERHYGYSEIYDREIYNLSTGNIWRDVEERLKGEIWGNGRKQRYIKFTPRQRTSPSRWFLKNAS